MDNEQISRDYRITDSELTMFTQHICDCITRDISEFSAFNVLAANVSALQTLCDAFEIFPTDEFIYQEYLSATEEKDNLVAEIKVMMRNIALRVELKWGKSSQKYKSLGIADMSQLNDEAFTTRARMLWAFANDYKTELASEGLTQVMLDDLNDKIQDLDDARRDQIKKGSYRVEMTTERITKGNELYNLVARYCEIGKRIWDGVNPAFYNDYIIYTTTSPGSLTAPQNFMFDPVNYDFSWSAVANATSYILQQSTDGTNWSQYWSGHETTCAYEESPTTVIFFRVIAHNAGGNSAPSTVIQYNFAPGLIAPTNFNYNAGTFYFSWNAVPNAEYYEFQYRAQTNPTWNSLNAGSATSFYHADPPGDYVARVRGAVGTNFGPWSVEEEYSVGAP